MIKNSHQYSTTSSLQLSTSYSKKPQEATRSRKKPQEASRSLKKPIMSCHKNFVVSFRNDTDSINSIMNSGIKNNIMSIMIAINSSKDFETAKKQKIQCIQDFIYSDMRIIDYMIMLYGTDLVMQQYQERFGEIVYSPILTFDFATLIIDNIIVICEYNHVSLDNAFIDSPNAHHEDNVDQEEEPYVLSREPSGYSERSFSTVSSLAPVYHQNSSSLPPE